MTSGSLWNYYKVEVNDDLNENDAATIFEDFSICH